VRIWPYAGNSEYPALLVGGFAGSDNASGADNQQERPAEMAGILRDHTPDALDRRAMRWSHLHGDMQGTASKGVPFHLDMSKEDTSEIPCRVIELPGAKVISYNNRLITGKPSSYATLQGRRDARR
jgi:hypothetical protein